MRAHLVQPGSVLADRYVIEDLLSEEGDSASWRARDKILARSVVLQVLPSSSPYAGELLAAAKKASRVADPRILQVLDAVDDGELTYVVREWATGQSLDVVLSEGPLPARRATWLMREVAAAMTNAHQMGLPHRRLAPDTVVLTKSSGIKVIGLGTFAALRAPDALPAGSNESPHSAESAGSDGEADPHREDTLDLGRLLYACLTARWPGGPNAGLPAAPTEHGRLLRPRQVRAGVPRSLDAVCDRVLGQPPRYGEPITTVEEIKENLSRILSEEGFTGVGSVGLAAPANPAAPVAAEPHPALLPRDDMGPPTGDQPTYAGDQPVGPSSSPLGRTLMWTVIAVLVLGAMLLAFLVGQRGNGGATPPDSSTPQSGTSSATEQELTIQGAQDLDPLPDGSGDENPALVPLAVDGNPSTAWETRTYFNDPKLGGQKSGVGLIVDLGRAQDVSKVDVTLQGDPTDLELRAAPASAQTAPTESADDYQVVDELTGAGTDATFEPDKPVRTRFLLVWLTKLPQVSSGDFSGRIAEIKVFG
ncbi:MAG: protein kinase family protein [Nocardioidaceae bacterium]